MGFQDREIERKLETESDEVSIDYVYSLIDDTTKNSQTGFTAGISTDTYWALPNKPDAFFRARDYGKYVEVTYKNKDKGNSFDRQEKDMILFQPIDRVIELYSDLLGKPIGKIEKRYYVSFFSDSEFNSISCTKIKVNSIEIPKVFIEVEGKDKEWVDSVAIHICDILANTHIPLKLSEGSFFDMFLNEKKVSNG